MNGTPSARWFLPLLLLLAACNGASQNKTQPEQPATEMERFPVADVAFTEGGKPASVEVESISSNGRELLLRVQADDCTRLSATAMETPDVVRILVVRERLPDGPCAAAIRFQRQPVTLEEPLRSRLVEISVSVAASE